MNNGPLCSVRCLLSSWKQCLCIIGLSFLCFVFFFLVSQSTLEGAEIGSGDSLGVKLLSVWMVCFLCVSIGVQK